MFALSNDDLRICEVGPRDGLQNQPHRPSVATKKQYIESLIHSGVEVLEGGSFVREDLLPQMAGSDEIAQWLGEKHPTVEAFFLVPNQKGLERALLSGVKSIALFCGASQTFNQKNIGKTLEESLDIYQDVAETALSEGLKVRGYVSTVWGCPYEGDIEIASVLHAVQGMLDLGCFEVSLGDTIGVATPPEVEVLLESLFQQGMPTDRIAVHFHDTYGMALGNVYQSLMMGVRSVDSSSGGLGGCPFAPGATGNLGTEDVLYLAQKMGFKTNIKIEEINKASRMIYDSLKIENFSSKTAQALEKRKLAQK